MRFRVILISAFILFSCDTGFLFDTEKNTSRSNFEFLWNTFNERYAVFEDRSIDWDDVYNRYAPLVTDQTTNQELYTIFKNMLAELNDPHVHLNDGNEWFNSNIYFREQIRGDHFSWETVKTYLPQYKTHKNNLAYGRIAESVGYVWVAEFSKNLNDAADEIVSAFADYDAIIMDLRHNNGGDFYNNGFPFFARFLDQKRFILKTIAKDGVAKNDFASPVEFHVSPKGKQQFNKPIIVLTDRYTVSAGEAVTYAFSQLPYVTLMGDTTAGGAGDIVGKDLPNGWGFSVTVNKVETVEGTTYEGIGISPDIPTQSFEEGKDLVLEEAIQYIQTHIQEKK